MDILPFAGLDPSETGLPACFRGPFHRSLIGRGSCQPTGRFCVAAPIFPIRWVGVVPWAERIENSAAQDWSEWSYVSISHIAGVAPAWHFRRSQCFPTRLSHGLPS